MERPHELAGKQVLTDEEAATFEEKEGAPTPGAGVIMDNRPSANSV